MAGTVNSLNRIVKSGGYLSFNKATDQFEIKHNHFGGRLVVWLHYKFSKSYKQAVSRATDKLYDVMSSDKVYQKYFRQRIADFRTPEFLKEPKPISARHVHLFIIELQEEDHRERDPILSRKRQQLEDAKQHIARFSAHSNKDIDRTVLNGRIDKILKHKVQTMPGIEAEDVNREGLSEELYTTAIADQAGIEKMESMDDAEKFIEEVLEGILDKRIGNAQANQRTMLKEQLRAAALPKDLRLKVEAEINGSEISTKAELDRRVNDLVLKQIDKQFNNLLDRACKEYGLDKNLLSASDVADSLPDYLLSRADRRLSLDSAPLHVLELLRNHALQKKETAEKLIDLLTGKDDIADSRAQFKQRTEQMFTQKIEGQPGLHKGNVMLFSVDEEVRQAALDDAATVGSEAQANELIDQVMSGVLDRRIADARVKLQARLRGQLADTELPMPIRNSLEADINAMKILSPSQLNRRIAAFALEKISGDFDALVAATAKKYGFDAAMLAEPEQKQRLLQHLASDLSEAKDDVVPSQTSLHTKAMAQLNRQRLDLAGTWVKRWSGVGDDESRELFKVQLNTLLAKENAVSGIAAERVQTAGLGEQISREILSDPQNIAAIDSEADAEAMVSTKLSALLAPRIEQVHLENKEKLYRRLAAAELPDSDYRNLDAEITDLRITTMEQLNRAVHGAIVKQIDSEFDDLLLRVKKGYRFEENLDSLSTVRAQVREQIAGRGATSVRVARDHAVELLEQWLHTKAQALSAIEQSGFAGTELLLKRLVLQEPYMTKVQVKEFQRAIEETLNDAYRQDPDGYDAVGMNAQNILSKLERMEGNDALYDDLRERVQGAEKPKSLFDKTVWHATDIESTVGNHIANTAAPSVNSYRRVKQLKGQVPKSIYAEAKAAVMERGAVWGEEFVAATNGLYVNTLRENNNAAVYELLESPVVSEQPLGSTEHNIPLTFKDLVDSTIEKKKHLKKKAKRQQAIDKLIPAAQMDYLLEDIARDLSQVRNRVMDGNAAKDLFRKSTLNFLRNARIDFANKTIDFNRRATPTPAYETTV